jgi:hypothetical protein
METETYPICRLYVGYMHLGIQQATPARMTQEITFSRPRCWGFSSSGMWRRAAGRVLLDVSNERNVFSCFDSPNINDEGITCLRKVRIHWPSHTESHLRRPESSILALKSQFVFDLQPISVCQNWVLWTVDAIQKINQNIWRCKPKRSAALKGTFPCKMSYVSGCVESADHQHLPDRTYI